MKVSSAVWQFETTLIISIVVCHSTFPVPGSWSNTESWDKTRCFPGHLAPSPHSPSLPLTPPHYYIPSHCMVARFGKPLSAPPAFPLFLLMSGLFLRLLRGACTHCGHIELQLTQRFSPVWNDEMTFNAECFLNQLVSTCRHWHKDLWHCTVWVNLQRHAHRFVLHTVLVLQRFLLGIWPEPFWAPSKTNKCKINEQSIKTN